MSTHINHAAARPRSSKLKMTVGIVAVVLVVGAIALDTTVVSIGSDSDVRQQGFSSETYGAEQFPKIAADVEKRAIAATELAPAVMADKKAAGEKYGIATTTGRVLPVSFTGVVGVRKGNTNEVKVDGLPPEIVIRVQTGPAINGTDLRDATGTIEFGQFTNQIEYQDAGSAINNQMKNTALSVIDADALSGKTIAVTGVFKLINPTNWLVTPVKVDVK